MIKPIAANHQGNEASLVRNRCLVSSLRATLFAVVAEFVNAMKYPLFAWLAGINPASQLINLLGGSVSYFFNIIIGDFEIRTKEF
jgi:hypothetical protein